MNSKIKYLMRQISGNFKHARISCPSCGSEKAHVVARKYLVSTLRRCESCALLFRAPTDDPVFIHKFYQSEYSQGFTTDMPDEKELQLLLENAFRGTEKDYTAYLEVLHALTPPEYVRLLDFGCSWGYGSWQLKNAGYSVDSYEISMPRALFARQQLGLHVYTDITQISDKYDVIFMSHVLEHLPSVRKAIEFVMIHLKDGGLFICFTPNGSEQYRKENPYRWMRAWSMVHPNMLDSMFYAREFMVYKHVICSDPYDLRMLNSFIKDTNSCHSGELNGAELLVVVRRARLHP